MILSRGKRQRRWNGRGKVVTRIGLTLNEAKTSIKQARTESFDFLGYTFGPHRYRERWPLVSGSESVEEERSAHQAESGRPSGAQQCRDVAGGTRSTQSDSDEAGRRTSATAPGRWHIGRSTTTSISACGISCGGATRCSRAAPAAFPMKWCMASWELSGSVMSTWRLVRESDGEASRKAGCGKSARPV